MSRQDFSRCIGGHRHINFKMGGIYQNFSKIYERRYLIIRLVNDPTTHVDADEDKRWPNKQSSAPKNIC